VNLRSRRFLLSVAALLVPTVAGCSLPAEDRVSQIDADDLGPELANPTTTTTTTVPVTTVPVPTDPSLSQATTTTTTTIVELPTERQRIFYTIGSGDDLGRVTIEMTEDASYPSIQNELESPRQEVRLLGLATDVRPGLIDDYLFSADDVTLTVALDPIIFDAMSETERRNAIGQIVLTFTSFAPPDTGAIGFVNFTIDGSPISVPVPRTQSASDPGQPLTFADFQPLLGNAVDTSDTTPPSTEPSTTAPAETAPVTTAAP
jgi:hypothetical protein